MTLRKNLLYKVTLALSSFFVLSICFSFNYFSLFSASIQLSSNQSSSSNLSAPASSRGAGKNSSHLPLQSVQATIPGYEVTSSLPARKWSIQLSSNQSSSSNHSADGPSRESEKNSSQLSLQSVQAAVPGYKVSSSLPARKWTDESAPGADFMTQTSGFCDPSSSKCAATLPSLQIVRVAMMGWAGDEFNMGAYNCPLTRCMLSKHSGGQMDYDVLVSSVPPRVPLPRKSLRTLRTRHAEISIESSINHPSFFVPTSFATNNVDLVISFQPPQAGSVVQFLPTSYINAEMDAFLAGGEDDNPWLEHQFRHPAMAAVISNCGQQHSKRIDVLTNILKGFPRAYLFGQCFKGHQSSQALPPNLQKCLSLPRRSSMWDKPKECILQNVMFSYSVENSFEKGYMTEKLWQPLKMGAIPIYSLSGVLENRKILPHPDSALIIEDFESTEQLAIYMHQVSKNRTLWFKHAMAWRYLPRAEVSKHFLSAVNNSLVTLPCRICDWWKKDSRDEKPPAVS